MSEKFHISRPTIGKILERNKVPDRGRVWTKLGRERERRFCEMYDRGKLLSELSFEFGITPTTAGNILKRNGRAIVKQRKYPIQSDIFHKLTSQSAYWLGYLYARGLMRSNFHLLVFAENTPQREAQINRLRRFLGTNQPWYVVKNQIRLVITCKELVKQLDMLGLNPLTKINYPQAVTKRNLDIPFIRGFLDGQGSTFRIKEGYCIELTANTPFLLELQKIIDAKWNSFERKQTVLQIKQGKGKLRYQGKDAIFISRILASTKANLPRSDQIDRILHHYKKSKKRLHPHKKTGI